MKFCLVPEIDEPCTRYCSLSCMVRKTLYSPMSFEYVQHHANGEHGAYGHKSLHIMHIMLEYKVHDSFQKRSIISSILFGSTIVVQHE